MHPAVDAANLVALGYCFGGLCVLDLARANSPGLKGVANVHGVPLPPEIVPQSQIDASVMVLHCWEDPVVPPHDVLALAEELTKANADWQLHAYGHAKQAFTAPRLNFPERGLAYNEDAARRSWSSLQAFLGEMFDR